MEQQKMGKQKEEEYKVIRILSKDIEGKMKIYSGLTKIKGISWALSNAICKVLGIDKEKRIGDLTEKEISDITEFAKNPQIPNYLVNRRKDFETGEDKHLISSDLDLQHDFDLKRLKKTKSYRGLRHMSGLPVRGQRTKSNFRRNRAKGSGIKKKNKQ